MDSWPAAAAATPSRIRGLPLSSPGMSYQKIPPESYPPPGHPTPYHPPSAPPEGSFDRFPPPQTESYQSYFQAGGYPQPPQFPPHPSPYPPQQYPYPPPYAPQQYPPPEHSCHHRDDDGCPSFLRGCLAALCCCCLLEECCSCF